MSKLLIDIQAHTLEELNVVQNGSQMEKNLFGETQFDCSDSLLWHFDRIMAEKKMHEVLVFSDTIAKLGQFTSKNFFIYAFKRYC